MMRKPLGKLKDEGQVKRQRRKLGIRKKISGEATRPRICAVRSNKNIAVQVIDDTKGVTLFAVNSYGKNAVGKGSNKEAAKLIGAKVAEKLKANNVATAVFDRNGFQYAGVLSVLADSIRENGIQV
jgi:large subunit ribosomal protein L18